MLNFELMKKNYYLPQFKTKNSTFKIFVVFF